MKRVLGTVLLLGSLGLSAGNCFAVSDAGGGDSGNTHRSEEKQASGLALQDARGGSGNTHNSIDEAETTSLQDQGGGWSGGTHRC